MTDDLRGSQVGRESLSVRLSRLLGEPLLVHAAVYWPLYVGQLYCLAVIFGAVYIDYVPSEARHAEIYLQTTMEYFGIKKYAGARLLAYQMAWATFPPMWLLSLGSIIIKRRDLRRKFNEKTHNYFERRVFGTFCVCLPCVAYLSFGLQIKTHSRLSFLFFSDSAFSFMAYVWFVSICYVAVAQLSLAIYGWKVTSWKTRGPHG